MSIRKRTWTQLLFLGALVAALPLPAVAQRPSAPKLLPDKTLAYIRVNDSRELAEAFRETSVGRILRDEQIRPLVQDLYGSAADAFRQVQDDVGASLDEILAIPQGEICVAIVGSDTSVPIFFAMIEVGEQWPVAQKLLERAEQQMTLEGWSRTEEEFGPVKLIIRQDGDDTLTYCERDGVILITSNAEFARDLQATWDGVGDTRTLADNRKFTSIMSRSAGTKEERPQISWYADPIELFRNLSRDNLGAQAGIAFLPLLGLDGLKAVGGSMILNAEEFESIQHIHILMDNPRKGVLQMIAMQPGDVTPEPWVPGDVASYMTMNWDARQTYDTLDTVIARFQGEGALKRQIDRRLSDNLGVDFETELLDQLAGRVTMATWFEKPIKVNSQTNLIGVKLVDADAFSKTIDKIAAKYPEAFSKKQESRITVYELGRGGRVELGEQEAALVRRPTPCMAVVGDYLLFSDSRQCLRQAIATKSGRQSSLADELDYKLIASKISRHAGEQEPGLIAFQRPEESFRMIYELATADNVRNVLSEQSENNQFLGTLNRALNDNPLPPFSVIAQYLAPAGGLMTNDETGIHYIAFSLKRNPQPESE